MKSTKREAKMSLGPYESKVQALAVIADIMINNAKWLIFLKELRTNNEQTTNLK